MKTGVFWERKKRQYMAEILRIKLECCSQYRDCLEASGNKVLIEDTTDRYWARGRDNKGRNVLGVIHCMLRANLKAQK